MGQRANLVLIENRKTTVYYNHWCANRLDKELFFGPMHAKRFIASQEEVVGDDGWLDEMWAEGGAALNLDSRHLVWYGGEDVLYEIPLRRVLLGMMREVWQGYQVDWAYEGIAEIADRAMVPRSQVLKPPKADDGAIQFIGESGEHFGLQPASVQWEDGRTLIYPYVGWETLVTLLNGPQIVDQLRKRHGLSKYCAGRGRTDLSTPTGGFHLDLITKTLTFWQSHERANSTELLSAIWPGWTFQWERDRFETQTELTHGALTFVVEHPHQSAVRVRDIVLHQSKPVDPLSTVRALEEKGYSVTHVNPLIQMDAHVELDTEIKSEVAERAMQHFLAKGINKLNDNAREMS